MQSEWITRGFEDFRRGSFDSGGQNLYVSRAGVLQRLHFLDLNGDGWPDLLICNSQNHWERPPCYVYPTPLAGGARVELPSDGSVAGVVADLNGDGYDDLVLAMDYNGSRTDLNAFIYYGGPGGLSPHRRVEIPAPGASAVACGDFNGDGRPDLAFVCGGRVRLFAQSDLGFEPQRFVDLPLEAEQIVADDLDGDGYADLFTLTREGQARVYWGGADGLSPERCTTVEGVGSETRGLESPRSDDTPETERPFDARALAQVVRLGGRPHLFLPGDERFRLAPVGADRTQGEPLVIAAPHALAVAVGDVNGDGHEDLVVASRGAHEGQECSWVYWGGPGGFDEARRTALPSHNACDVAVGDLDGDGCADIVLGQDRTDESYSYHSLVYRGTPTGVEPEPLTLEGHDTRRVLIARTSAAPDPQVILVNHRARRAGGDVDPMIYWGGPEGFNPARRHPLRGRDAVDAVCCDLDDDGFPEIVTANCSENATHLDPGSFIFRGQGGDYAYEPATILPTTRAHGVCCADLNHDGYLDLVFVGFSFGDILIFYGGPEGYDIEHPQRISMATEGERWDQPRWISLADLNGDGWLDLIVPQIGSDRSFILWNGPDGFSMERKQLLSVIHASCAQAADLTGNGYLDLIIAGHTPSLQGPHDSFVYVYWNGPEGLREDNRMQLPAQGVNALGVADFNNDGHLDLFVANYHDGRERDIHSFIYWGQEDGTFRADCRTRLFAHSASGAVTADFNRDGWVDLGVAYHKVENDHLGHSAVWWNGPEGFSERHVTCLPSEGPHGMTRVGSGNQRDRGPEELYTSAPYELPDGVEALRVNWEADVPEGTWVRAQVRVAETEEALAQAAWLGPEGEGSWGGYGDAIALPTAQARWMQYRLALGARDGCGTPRVSAVRVSWTAAGR